MNNRNYNVLFNTHTVSGIVISIALYIIFFAGAFTLFKNEIRIWEEGKPLTYTQKKDIDFDKIFIELDKNYDLIGRDLQISFDDNSDHVDIYLYASQDSLASDIGKEYQYLSVNIHSYEAKTYEESYSLGDFLYYLHFFGQLPYIGAYLAGFVSLFFLFAIATGVIIHWNKIITNFYYFNPKATLKRVWTDAHTALGILSLPFQFIFAISGAYFCLSILVLLPAGILYNGDQEKLTEDMLPARKTYQWLGKSELPILSFNQFAKNTEDKWENFYLNRAYVKNYGGENMKYLLMGEIAVDKRFIGVGATTYNAYTGVIESEKNPTKLAYIEDAQFVFGRLHFGDFGGIALKLIYFILALISCFVIISGVLIWLEARNKRNMTISQRLYTANVGHIYLAICLSMLPVTALAFIFSKLAEGHFANKLTAIYWFYFVAWLVFILYFRFKRDNYFTNKSTLLLGAVLGFLIPIVNGFASGNWIWLAYQQQQLEILLIDLLWIAIGSMALFSFFKIKPAIKAQSAFTKHPIDYKNIKQLKAAEAEKLQENNDVVDVASSSNKVDLNYISMRTKIALLWFFLAFSWLIHHVYGLFNIYYNETLIIEGATGSAPIEHHIFRILFEGFCLLFALLTIEIDKQWFKITSLVWASIAGLYNIYHVIAAFIYEPGNISEIFILVLVVVANVFLILNLNKWRTGTNINNHTMLS